MDSKVYEALMTYYKCFDTKKHLSLKRASEKVGASYADSLMSMAYTSGIGEPETRYQARKFMKSLRENHESDEQ